MKTRILLMVMLLSAAPMAAAQGEPDSVAAESADAAEASEATEAAPVLGPRVSLQVLVYDKTGRPSQLGGIVIEVYPDDAPEHVANFLKLAKDGFYEGTTFHRIVPAMLVQGGDPRSRFDWADHTLGRGGPDYTIPSETGRRHLRGAVGASRLGDDVNPDRASNGSQFYVCLADLPSLDASGYTVFGKVVEGMDVVDAMSRIKNAGTRNRNRALQRVTMTKVTVIE